LRSIALFEAAKGVVALMAATGVMLHRQLRPIIIELAGHLHLNPASDRPLAILHALEARASMHLRLLALGVLIYAGIRLLEAAGLWRGMAWALWLGAVSAAIYLPFEIVEFAEHPRALPLALLVLNGGVAIYLTRNAIVRS
jgi:uncharacterized membrane protein (DUF2068 family)